MFDTPMNFKTEIVNHDFNLTYTNLMEICQGGPEVGNITIDGVLLNNNRFGGPVLYKDKHLYIPIFIKSFFYSGFKLARISTDSLEMKIFGKTKNLIFLDSIENNIIYYFEDLGRKERNSLELF